MTSFTQTFNHGNLRAGAKQAKRTIGVGMARRPPLPPNRTGGFPASGFPVGGLCHRSARLALAEAQEISPGCVERAQAFCLHPFLLRAFPTSSPSTFLLYISALLSQWHSRQLFLQSCFCHASTFLPPLAPRSLLASSLLWGL